MNEEFSDIIDQFLVHFICMHKNRYNYCGFLHKTGLYLNEVVGYLCSSTYVNTFNRLLTRLVPPDQSILDHVEEFYLLTCPIYAYSSKENNSYMQVSTFILEKMFQVYVDIFTQFIKIIKNCLKTIIEPTTWLMVLLQCTSIFHEIRLKFTNISQELIDIMWTIIYKLSLQRESHIHTLLASTIAQMFYAIFELEILPIEIRKWIDKACDVPSSRLTKVILFQNF
jgi:hypothetical protein